MSAVRARTLLQENGSLHDLEPCEKQYTQIPFAHLGMERRRDLAAISRGGQKFPLNFCLVIVSVCVFITVFLMPFLALRTVPTTRSDIPWWKEGVTYHIYLRSFCDSDGDGVGDLRGVVQKLDYLQGLGVVTIQLSPFYESPMVDFGYDVSNHTQVDALFGTMADFDNLVKEVHARKMRLMVDFIPNHTSNKHPWFQQSSVGDATYADFYVWNKGKQEGDEPQLPNNWVSTFGGSAWEWDAGRKQFYYHRYEKRMPDLNFRNPKVIEAIKEVLRFWLERGVDGFRIDAMEGLLEDHENLNEPRTFVDGQKPGYYHYLEHVYTNGQQDSLVLMSVFHQVIAAYALKVKKEIIIIPEVNIQHKNPDFWMSTYEYGGHMPTNKALFDCLKPGATGHQLDTHINSVLNLVPFDKGDHWIAWASENHDHGRIASRLGPGNVEAGLALSLLLPGTGFTYYGQELGLANINLTYEQTVDPKGRNAGKDNYMKKSRDPGRSPMQWNNKYNAGFTTGNPWLPINPNFHQNNAEAQLADPKSVLHSYKRLVALRKHLSFLLGQHNPMVITDEIYSFARINRGRLYARFIVAMNIGAKASVDNYQATNVTLKVPEDNIKVPVALPQAGTVVYQSSNWADDLVGSVIPIDRLELKPGQVIVIRI